MKINQNLLKLCFTYLLLLFQLTIYGQNYNFGLKQPQHNNTLPRSAKKTVFPEIKPLFNELTYLNNNNGEYILEKGWRLIEEIKSKASGELISSSKYNSENWYNATVPGTVLTSLVDQGIYPDPYFGLNNLSIPDSLSRQSWWYRINFKSPETDKDKAWIVINGINYSAKIWFNGHMLGTIKGAFIRKEFEVSDYMNKTGDNVLAINIFPPPNPGIPHEESPAAGTGPNGGQLCLDGPTFISSEGWDWIPGIRDRNMGIWQDVRLRFSGSVTLRDPQVITDLNLPDTTLADITIRSKITNNGDTTKTVNLIAEIDKKKFTQKVELQAGETKQLVLSSEKFKELLFKNPLLWWPNGYGDQNLYYLDLTIKDENGNILDQDRIRFGIRELSYELTIATDSIQTSRIELNPLKDLSPGQPIVDNTRRIQVLPEVEISSLAEGADINKLTLLENETMSPYLVIRVNGKRIFCKGGNWGMDDGMKRVSRERLEPAMKLHQKANFNMVRNWTGENTEEIFYELCDEYGMLVWNDFWMSTEGYNLEPNNNLLFLKNARDVIKRFRNHPSIAIWCPRNEGYAPPKLEKELQNLVNELDGTRFYQGNSRNLNLSPSGPWNYTPTPKDYFTKNAFGFSTELGTPSIPTAETMRKMMAEPDLWPISDVWYYHDFHEGQKAYVKTIENLYEKPNNLEDFCKRAQFVNYDSHRAMFEAWNSRMWDNTSGLLLWMTHPAWPSTVWQVYSWDFETFGSYFASKKACEPTHVQMNLNDKKVVVVNASLKNYKDVTVLMKVYDLKSKEIYSQSLKLDVSPNKLVQCFTPQLTEDLPDIYLIRLKLTDKNGNLISDNEYWKTSEENDNFYEFNQLPLISLTPKILQKNTGSMNQITFQIKNNSETPALNVKFNLRNKIDNKILLPAYFSDGYFTLLPGETKEVSVEYPVSEKYGNVVITSSGYNIETGY
jgi:hypothetical protein